MTSPLLSGSAAALLTKASKRLQAFPTSTLLLAVLACAGDDTLSVREVDEALLARGSHDLMGADAVEEIEAILAAGATVPVPTPTEEAPAPDVSAEEHLRAALAHLEAAIKGFTPGPAVYALEYTALDLRGAINALDLARTLEAEKAVEAALWIAVATGCRPIAACVSTRSILAQRTSGLRTSRTRSP